MLCHYFLVPGFQNDETSFLMKEMFFYWKCRIMTCINVFHNSQLIIVTIYYQCTCKSISLDDILISYWIKNKPIIIFWYIHFSSQLPISTYPKNCNAYLVNLYHALHILFNSSQPHDMLPPLYPVTQRPLKSMIMFECRASVTIYLFFFFFL